ncbi:MAG: hypothetical protein ACRDMJ_06175, partial [Solirubrobacteraceae bacterium]
VHDIPAPMLSAYEQAGTRYRLPWQLLAGIGQEECDQGRSADPSCAPVPGARGPGVANAAGASGPMQIGVGGAAGDAYDQLRGLLPPTQRGLGPHDPQTAADLAALVLIHDKGARPGQPLGAYAGAVAAYNGTGPAAQQYSARVLAEARAYGSGGTDGAACAGAEVALVAGSRARILTDGQAAAPSDAPAVVQAMIAAGNRIDHFPYSYAGGHGAVAQTMSQTAPDPAAFPGEQENGGPGYDCSSATDYVLYGGGFGQSLLGGLAPASTTLESVGEPGPGRWVTIYANASHAYIEVAGIYLDTAAGEGRPPNPPSTGPRWTPTGTGPGGFVARHPPGL